jgi:hypothetical protein
MPTRACGTSCAQSVVVVSARHFTFAAIVVVFVAAPALAQAIEPRPDAGPATKQTAGPQPAAPLSCVSKAGERTQCPADTSAGAALVKSTGTGEATSQIFGDKEAGFDNSSEYLAGLNFYPLDTRQHRLNLQIMDVNRSPVSSTFGYYVGGQTGTTYSDAFSVFF